MKESITALALAVGLLGCRGDAAVGAASGKHEPRVVFLTASGEVPVEVEIADTPAEQRRGLMFRRELAEGTGMLFVFEVESEHSFWMKNTYVPLDMIFVSAARRVVGVIADAEPLSEDSRTIGKPSQYVVEVPAGFARQHGITPGTPVLLALAEGGVAAP